MKAYKFILLVFSFFLFGSSSCESPKAQYYITIQNNSDNEVLIVGSLYSSVSKDSLCFKPTTKVEYENFIHYAAIKPHSIKKMKIDKEQMQKYNLVWSLGVFNRIDMDAMSCEEFEQAFPLKKEWKVTLADIEMDGWTLVYP